MKSYIIGAITIRFTDETNNGYRKVLIEQPGKPTAIDWQPKRSKCTKPEAQQFARKHGEYTGMQLVEITIVTYANIDLWEGMEATA